MPEDKFIPALPKEPDWDFLSRDIEAGDFRRTPEVPLLPKSREAVGSLIETMGDDGFRPGENLTAEGFLDPAIDEEAEGVRDADTQIAMNKYFGGEPAMEPLTREDIFPGNIGVRQVGTSGGPVTGPQPVFVAGGGLFPFEIINARKRALERGAASAVKKKKDFVETWNKTVKFEETAPQYDQLARAQFIDWSNWRFNTLTEELGGNGMKAGAMLLDPTTKQGQEFLKDIELWNSYSRNLKDIGLDMEKIAKKVTEGYEISPEMFKMLSDFNKAAENPRAFIEGGGDINKFREPSTISVNLIDAVDNSLSGVKGLVSEKLEYNRSIGVGVGLYESQMKTIFSDEQLETLTDEIWTPSMKGAGVTRERVRKLLKAKFENEKQTIKVIKEPAKTKITIGGKKRDERIFTDLYQQTIGPFFAKFDEITDSDLTTKQKGTEIGASWEEATGLKSFDGNLLAGYMELTKDQTSKKYSTTQHGMRFLYKDTGKWLNLNDYKAQLKVKEGLGEPLRDEETNLKELESDTGFNVFINRQRFETTVRRPDGKEHIAGRDELAENPELIDNTVPTTTLFYRGHSVDVDGNEKKLPESIQTDHLDRPGSLRNANIRWRGIGTGGKTGGTPTEIVEF